MATRIAIPGVRLGRTQLDLHLVAHRRVSFLPSLSRLKKAPGPPTHRPRPVVCGARHDGRVGSGRDQGWVADGRVVRAVRHDPAQPVDTTTWPATVPAVEHVLAEGLEFPAGLTVLVGENGSGKSTVVEMLAAASG